MADEKTLSALLADTKTQARSSLLHEGLQLLLQGRHLGKGGKALQEGTAGTPGSSSPSASVFLQIFHLHQWLFCAYVAELSTAHR